MAKIYDISARKITRLQNYYPLVNIDAIPEKYQRIPITFRSDEIEKFDVIFFHRLMKFSGSNIISGMFSIFYRLFS
ncbi:MAG: hypothetical protein B5M53_03715 [Candidatus Cloacimonas sp. 4484_209]|nr:MAG: hypothetical protein B5M53_03715 [Candidatus Cloacimonas sp. 4484_209]